MSNSKIAESFAAAGLTFTDEDLGRFSTYLDLLLRWNSRLNLTAIRREDEIIRRHFVECVFAARHLPSGISTLLDFGSGAGFPGIPIAIACPRIAVTLAESRSRKAAFLQEVKRTISLSAAIYDGRVEDMPAECQFDAVCLRAVDRMDSALEAALRRAKEYVVLFTSEADLEKYHDNHPKLVWREPVWLPGGDRSILAVGELHVPRGTT